VRDEQAGSADPMAQPDDVHTVCGRRTGFVHALASPVTAPKPPSGAECGCAGDAGGLQEMQLLQQAHKAHGVRPELLTSNDGEQWELHRSLTG